MTRQVPLTEEVAAAAERLAAAHGLTVPEIVERALRLLERSGQGSVRSEGGRAEALQALEALSARTSRLAVPGASSDHSDLYDENGLPH